MMLKISLRLLLLSTIFIFSCQSPGNEADKLIGAWRGVSWTANDQNTGRDATAVRFQFNADGTYTGVFGQQNENGTYRMSGKRLYTNAENQIEKMVETDWKTADTLIFKMNRVGTPEVLTLVRE